MQSRTFLNKLINELMDSKLELKDGLELVSDGKIELGDLTKDDMSFINNRIFHCAGCMEWFPREDIQAHTEDKQYCYNCADRIGLLKPE